MAKLESKIEDIKNYNIWEKICKGYEISLKNLEQSLKEERPNAYINDNEKNLGKEFLHNKWVEIGACITHVRHPVLFYKNVKLRDMKKGKEDKK